MSNIIPPTALFSFYFNKSYNLKCVFLNYDVLNICIILQWLLTLLRRSLWAEVIPVLPLKSRSKGYKNIWQVEVELTAKIIL